MLSRRKEEYHSKIADASRLTKNSEAKSIHDEIKTKEPGLEKLLVYDSYRHGCLIEHFLAPGSSSDFRNGFDDLGDFVTSAFEWGWNQEDGALRLAFLGSVLGKPVRLKKTLAVSPGSSDLKVTYSLTNESSEELRFRFASEWAFHLLAPNAPDRYYESQGQKLPSPAMNSAGCLARSSSIRLVDEYLKLAIGLEPVDADEVARYPLETVSMSEGGFERMFQGSILMPIWNLQLNPGKTWTREMTVRFELIS